MHALLCGVYDRRRESIAHSQLYPLFHYRDQFRKHIGLTFDHVDTFDLDEIERACEQRKLAVAAFIIRPDWRSSPDDTVQMFARLRARHPGHRIVLIDPWDQCTGRLLGALPYVDKLVKYQRLADPQAYYRELVGGTVPTDYFSRQGGYDIPHDLGSTAPPGTADRIMSGWYVSCTRWYRWELAKPRVWPFVPVKRPIDLVCHVSYSRRDEVVWYTQHRQRAVAALQRLSGKYRVVATGEYAGERTVTRRQYLSDMRRARIAVGVFGWGEISTRDYEAACFSNLLMRPSVEHVAALPDIFRANETYVPLKWDFSDLDEKVDHYLSHWDEAERIIANARNAYRTFFAERQYVRVMAEALALQMPR